MTTNVEGAVSAAAIKACALMIKGICMTRPQDVWTENIEARIRFMLSRASAEVQAEAVKVDARYQWLRRRAVMVDCSDETAIRLILFKNEGPTGEFLDDWIDTELAAPAASGGERS